MKATEVQSYLRSLDGGWVDWEDTTDRFIAGDPESEITGIAVGWMSYRSALERAQELRCNLFITHEPTYFSGHDDEERIYRFPGVRAKRRWIEEQGIVILRCHDVWDQLPEIGIPDSWARFLGLDRVLAADGYYRLVETERCTARALAEDIASRTASLGQQAVELVGPPNATVSRIALGTGAITPFTHFLDIYQPDLAICTDDGFTYWHAGALAIDLCIPAIVVNHAVSELPGMQSLTRHLAGQFPDVQVHNIPQFCMYALVGG
jgi:putative NIF3 family GTP cyclohydrolase 1 type 2